MNRLTGHTEPQSVTEPAATITVVRKARRRVIVQVIVLWCPPASVTGLKFVDPQHMGAVFSEDAERPEEVPDVEETEMTPVVPTSPSQDGGRRRSNTKRQTHHRSRTGINKRKTIRNRGRE